MSHSAQGASVCGLDIQDNRFTAVGENPVNERWIENRGPGSIPRYYYRGDEHSIEAVIYEKAVDLNPYLDRGTLTQWSENDREKVKNQVITDSLLFDYDTRAKFDRSSRQEVDMTYNYQTKSGELRIAERQTFVYVNPTCLFMLFVKSYKMDMQMAAQFSEGFRVLVENANPGKFWLIKKQGLFNRIKISYLIGGALGLYAFWSLRRRRSEEAY